MAWFHIPLRSTGRCFGFWKLTSGRLANTVLRPLPSHRASTRAPKADLLLCLCTCFCASEMLSLMALRETLGSWSSAEDSHGAFSPRHPLPRLTARNQLTSKLGCLKKNVFWLAFPGAEGNSSSFILLLSMKNVPGTHHTDKYASWIFFFLTLRIEQILGSIINIFVVPRHLSFNIHK